MSRLIGRPMGGWKHLTNPGVPELMRAQSDAMLRQALAAPAQMPDLSSTDTILVLTDSAGDRKTPFQVYSFLVTGRGFLTRWREIAEPMRKELGPRTISHKDLNTDVIVRRLMPRVLEAADRIPGLLFTVAIDKSLPYLFEPTDIADVPSMATWDRPTAEKAYRYGHYISFLLAGLARGGQDVAWVSDKDDVMSNPGKMEDLRSLLPIIMQLYLPFQLGRFHFRTTGVDPSDLIDEDMVSIPDLAAGATFRLLRMGAKSIAKSALPDGTRMTGEWLSRETGSLAKRHMRITRRPVKAKGKDISIEIAWSRIVSD